MVIAWLFRVRLHLPYFNKLACQVGSLLIAKARAVVKTLQLNLLQCILEVMLASGGFAGAFDFTKLPHSRRVERVCRFGEVPFRSSQTTSS